MLLFHGDAILRRLLTQLLHHLFFEFTYDQLGHAITLLSMIAFVKAGPFRQKEVRTQQIERRARDQEPSRIFLPSQAIGGTNHQQSVPAAEKEQFDAV